MTQMEISSAQDIGQKQNESITPSIPTVSLEFRWNNNSRWFKTELTHQEYAQTMSKGMIDGKPIVEVALWYQDEYCLTYSFSAAGSGNNPWKIETT